MGVLTDATAIQFRLLNRGKGPAMHSPRAQCDKKAYQFLAKLTVEASGRAVAASGDGRRRSWSRQGRVAGRACRGGVSLSGHGRSLSPRARFFRRSCTPAKSRRPAAAAATRPRSGCRESLRSLGFELEPIQDRHAAPAQRPHHRLHRLEPQPGDTEPSPVLVSDRRDRASRSSIAISPTPIPTVHDRDPGEPASGTRCTRARSRVPARDIARRSKTKSSGSPIATATRFSSSPKGETPSNTIATASRQACRATCRKRSFP